MEIYARQGDLIITRADHGKFSGGIKEVNRVLAGSGSSSHVIRGAALVAVSGRVISVRIAEPTEIEHGDRHLSTPLPAGDYDIQPLRERHGDTDQAVSD